MRDIIEGPPDAETPARPLHRRLAWFVVLALGGMAATGAVAYALRTLLGLE
jgi:uncharacterized protein involved in exopolysaccharide biosynthesis